MKKIVLAILCGLLSVGVSFAQAEKKAVEEDIQTLSAWDGLLMYKKNGGLVDMGGWMLDVSKMSIPSESLTYWKNMKIREGKHGQDEGLGSAYYFFVLEPLDSDNKSGMPTNMEFMFELFGPKGEGTQGPIYEIGELIIAFSEQPEDNVPDVPNKQKEEDHGIGI